MEGVAPRLVCARAFLRLFTRKGYGNLTLQSELQSGRGYKLSERENALCTRLFLGTLERLIPLENCVRERCGPKTDRLDLPVHITLLCGFYELLFLDTEDYAAVNLWVETVKALRFASAAALVNAVLRSFLRGGKAVPVPKDPLEALSARFSLPVPLLREMLADYGEEKVTGFLEDALKPPPDYIRQNPLAAKDSAIPQGAEAVECIPRAWKLAAGTKITGFSNAFHVQDLASQACALALEPKPGETVLDLCAAPGGKTFTIAEEMGDKGKVFAYDLRPGRVRLIEQGAKALGLSCVVCAAADAKAPGKPRAEKVLCDVPCSGYGVIRRKPEIRYKPLEDVQNLPTEQLAILSAASELVLPGGVLVYSTCTLRKAENEAVVERFLSQNSAFSLEEPWQNLPGLSRWGERMTTLFPEYFQSDGFFLAKLRRR